MLNMNPVVQVNVSVGASSRVATVFDVGAILTPEPGTGTAFGTLRFAYYGNMDEVLNGETDVKPAFAATTETYKAAEKYFGVSPAPSSLMICYFDGGVSSEETPVTAIADAINKGAEFYGVYYIPKVGETDANIKTYIAGIASALDAIARGVVFYGAVGTAASLATAGSLMQSMYASSMKRTIGMACTAYTNDAAGLMGVAMGYSSTAKERPFALCYKGIASATANDYSQTDVNTIKGVNGNVFVARTKTGAKIENGATASGLRYDEVLYIDMIANEIQENLYDMIANNATKLPQTDATTSLFIGEIYQILERYYNVGVLAPAAWRGNPVGNIATGDVLEHGYVAFAEPFDSQSDADRRAHKAMPITVLICLSGSVESIVINLDVQT